MTVSPPRATGTTRRLTSVLFILTATVISLMGLWTIFYNHKGGNSYARYLYSTVVDNTSSKTSSITTNSPLSSADLDRLGCPLTDDKQQTLQRLQNSKSPENATFVTLARNSDLGDLMNTIRSVEDRYNHRFHHDWVFLNNEDFDSNFKETVSKLISGNVKFGKIPKDHWSYPNWIDQKIAQEAREEMKNVIYGASESYRHMCRFESGFFFKHPILQDYKYYWRVEPSTLLHCDVDYDVFKFMREEKKKYGFTITLREFEVTVASLWDVTKNFLTHNPHFVAEDNLINFISGDSGHSYNLCHFWSNFEIADMDFWRDEPYQSYFDYLDRAGGFFYERWGDAPIHSLAVALFMNSTEIHLFDDIGYTHPPFTHCPANQKDRNLKCSCLPQQNFDWNPYSCMKQFYQSSGLQLPPDAKK